VVLWPLDLVEPIISHAAVSLVGSLNAARVNGTYFPAQAVGVAAKALSLCHGPTSGEPA
jgi:hypothetical protein